MTGYTMGLFPALTVQRCGRMMAQHLIPIRVQTGTRAAAK